MYKNNKSMSLERKMSNSLSEASIDQAVSLLCSEVGLNICFKKTHIMDSPSSIKINFFDGLKVVKLYLGTELVLSVAPNTDHYMLYDIIEGKLMIENNNKKENFISGCRYLLSPLEQSKIHYSRNTQLIITCIPPSVILNKIGDLANSHIRNRAIISDTDHTDIIPPPHQSNDNNFAKITQYIINNLFKDVKSDDIAYFCNISRKSVFNIVKRELGCTPSKYIKKIKIYYAYNEILGSDKKPKITDLATKYGFFNIGRFSQEYYSIIGERPSDTIRKTKK